MDIQGHVGQPVTFGKAPLGPLLMLGNVPFSTMWQRPHHFAAGLAEHTTVTYVDPNRSVLQGFRQRPVTDTPVPHGLTVVRPPAGLPGGRSSGLINQLNYAGCLRRLRTTEAHIGPPSAIVATFPDQLDLIKHYPNVPVVYDLMDDPELFLRYHQRARYTRLHAEMLDRAATVVVSARVLLERCKSTARRVVWISNGVSGELADSSRTAFPDPVVVNLPRPVFGFVGLISHWMDFETIRAIAESHPHGTVVLVGPSEVRLPGLPKNVVFTGPVFGRRVGAVLAGFDVGLIPFVRNTGIDAVNPLKLYEYLAAGLPVLAAGFEEIRQFRPLVITYDSPAEAARIATELIAKPPTAQQTADRRAFADGHRWEKKVAEMLAVICQATGQVVEEPIQHLHIESRSFRNAS